MTGSGQTGAAAGQRGRGDRSSTYGECRPRRARVPRIAPAWHLALLVGIAWSQAAAATPSPGGRTTGAVLAAPAPGGEQAKPLDETASGPARDIAAWIAASGDNQALPYIIVDKADARIFVFDGQQRLRGAAPALLGLGRGDDSVPGIGRRRLATIRPEERTTPAGRFQASLGHDFEQDLLWVDYDSALSLHRVIVGKVSERRHARLASPTPLDNRISYGCINVPAQFYDSMVAPLFKGTVGIVYILPETKPLDAVFAMRTDRPISLSGRVPQLAATLTP